MPCPSIAEPSHETLTQYADVEYLANPNPSNEHVCVDEEELYVQLGPQHSQPSKPQTQGGSKEGEGESSDVDTYFQIDSDVEFVSNKDYVVEDIDEIVKDSEHAHMIQVEYDKEDPPMTVGIVYADMNDFKLALASHAIRHEF